MEKLNELIGKAADITAQWAANHGPAAVDAVVQIASLQALYLLLYSWFIAILGITINMLMWKKASKFVEEAKTSNDWDSSAPPPQIIYLIPACLSILTVGLPLDLSDMNFLNPFLYYGVYDGRVFLLWKALTTAGLL